MNEKAIKKTTKKINSLDVALIAIFLVIACSVAAFFALRDTDKSTPQSVKILYTIKVENISNEVIDKVDMEVGDDVFDLRREKVYGNIVSVFTAPSCMLDKKIEFGNSLYSSVEGKSDLIVEIEADAYSVPSGYDINGYILTIGKSFDIYNPSYVFEGGYCYSITVVTDEEVAP